MAGALRRSRSRAERDHLALLRRTGRGEGSRAVVPGTDHAAAGVVAHRPTRWRSGWRSGHVQQHPVRQQLRGDQPGAARPVPWLRTQQRRARPALASRRRSASHAVRDPRVHGFAVSVQRPVLLAAVVLPVGIRRAAVHHAVPRCRAPRKVPRSAVTATSRTDSRASRRRWRRPCTTSVRSSTISSSPASTGSR